jgi:hypothetical protein
MYGMGNITRYKHQEWGCSIAVQEARIGPENNAPPCFLEDDMTENVRV